MSDNVLGRWILVIQQRGEGRVVVADDGETPVWDSQVDAWGAAQRLGLPRCSPRRVATGELYDPTPYREGMAFGQLLSETASWR